MHTGVGGTGVVGVLRRGNGQAAIGLRADVDALPIHEETGLEYASTPPVPIEFQKLFLEIYNTNPAAVTGLAPEGPSEAL